MFSFIRRFGVFASLITLCTLPGWAQFNSTLEGLVTDSTGAVVPEATVKITNVQTGALNNTRTTQAGYYRVASLPAGTYRVTVSKEGFNTIIRENVVLETARVQNVPVTLSVGALASEVTVTEAPPVVETSEARVSQLTEGRPVIELPLNGRNVLNVVAQTPGVTGTGLVSARVGGNDIFSAASYPLVTANGLRGSANGFYVDDTSTNDNPDQGGTKLTPNPDSIQEVRVSVNNYSAQYGRNSSVLTQIVTKSGTNTPHGSLFVFHTNDVLTARNVFQNVPNVSGKLVPTFRRNEFGGSYGMALRKDHTFIFGSYDQLISSQGIAELRTVETPAFTQFMRARYPGSIATKLLADFPSQVALSGSAQTVAQVMSARGLGACTGTNSLGMACDMGILQNGVLSTSAPRNGLQWNVRADQIWGSGKDRLYGNFYRMTSTSNTIATRGAFNTAPPSATHYATLNYTHTFSPTFVNEVAMGYVRNLGTGQAPNARIPSISITGMEGFGIGFGPAIFIQNDFHWRDLASFNRGSHALKAGFEIFRDRDNAPFTRPVMRPNFAFANVFDFAQDKPFQEGNINFDPRNGGPPFEDYGYRSQTYGFFVQDDWKVKSNLTLNLGARWDFSSNPFMNVGRLTNLQLGSGTTFEQKIAGTKVIPVDKMFENNRIGYVAPRFGFAWDPFRKGKMSVRGGFGIFFERWQNKVWSDRTRSNPPFLAAATASTFVPSGPQPLYALGTSDDAPFGFPLPGVQAGLNPGNGPICCRAAVGGVDQSLRYAYAENWFFGLQYSFRKDWVVEADYMGSGGKHLYNVIDRNRFAGDLIRNRGTLARLNPWFAGVNYSDNSGASVYHGGTVALRKLFSHGVNFQTSYTFGKAIDLINSRGSGSSSVTAPVIDAYDVRRQRGLSDNDISQKLAFNFLIDLPKLAQSQPVVGRILGGWTMSSMAILQGGYPFTVTTNAPFRAVWNDPACASNLAASCAVVGNSGGDYNADGTNFDLPNTPAFGNKKSSSRSDFQTGLFRVGDFPVPALGRQGDLGRNTFRGPGYAQVDLSLIKNNKLPWLGEAGTMQFRAEFYNFLNRVNFNGFDTQMTSGTFGRATSTFTPRAVQFALRLQF